MPRRTGPTRGGHDSAAARLDRAIRIALAAVEVGEGAFTAARDNAFAPSRGLALKLGKKRLLELTPEDAHEIENYLIERGRRLGRTRTVGSILRRERQRERELGHASAIDAILRRELRPDTKWRATRRRVVFARTVEDHQAIPPRRNQPFI